MRVLHVVYECTPGAFRGGVQKMVLELARAQAATGDAVEIWTLGEFPRFELDGVQLRYFKPGKRFSSRPLREALARNHTRFDVIHGHSTYLPPNRYVGALGRRGVRVFFHPHGALDPKLLSGWSLRAVKKRAYVWLFERWNFNAAAGVIGLTEEECRQILAIGTHAPVFQLPNGIAPVRQAATEQVAAFRHRLQLDASAPIVLFLGRLIYKKGIHLMVDAFARLRPAHPAARLVLCGDRLEDPPYVATLDAQIAHHGLADQVRWGGFVDERTKPAALGAATIFCHPSYSEGMAMAVLESMSAGVPTIVTPGCYMQHAVDKQAARLSSQDPAELAAVMNQLLRDVKGRRELGARAAEFIQREHDWLHIAGQLRSIYAGQGCARHFNNLIA